MKIGKNLKVLRLNSGLTQGELAEKLTLSKSNISKYEADDMEPSLTTLALLAKIFGVPISSLFGESSGDIPAQTRPQKPNWLIETEKHIDAHQSEYIKKYLECDDNGRDRINIIIDYEHSQKTGKKFIHKCISFSSRSSERIPSAGEPN